MENILQSIRFFLYTLGMVLFIIGLYLAFGGDTPITILKGQVIVNTALLLWLLTKLLRKE